MYFGEWLSDQLALVEKSQQALATAIGTTQPLVNRWCNSKTLPGLDYFFRLIGALALWRGVTKQDILVEVIKDVWIY